MLRSIRTRVFYCNQLALARKLFQRIQLAGSDGRLYRWEMERQELTSKRFKLHMVIGGTITLAGLGLAVATFGTGWFRAGLAVFVVGFAWYGVARWLAWWNHG